MLILFIGRNLLLLCYPAWGHGTPFRLCSSLVHSLPHLLLFITFLFFPFLIHFTYFLLLSIRSLSTSSHSVSRREVVGGDRTLVKRAIPFPFWVAAE